MHSRLCLWSSYVLVAIFHRHLALAAPPTPRSPSSEGPSSSSSTPASVVWSSPTPGGRFGPGDTITGEWQTTQNVVSPSFKLCAGGEDGCGATVWPEVVESAGYYRVSLTAPNVTMESGYYLQMKDDFGDKYTSPIFNLTPTPQRKEDSPSVAQPRPRPDQVPMSTPSPSLPHDSKSNGAAQSDPVAPAPADPGGGSVPGASPNSTASFTPGVGGGGPLVAAAHNAPPTAALAVPLSLTGAIVLIAGGLLLHHRRKLAVERQRCSAQLATNATTTTSSSESTHNLRPAGLGVDLGGGRTGTNTSSRDKGSDRYSYCGDADRAALFVRALFRGGCSDRHHAYDAYRDRRPDAPYVQGAPEPRPRTRQLDLLTREFSTHTRRRPYPSSSSASSSRPSSYRGIFGNRQSVRRSGSTNTYNGGASSLWRSLSIAGRKVATPSTLLASPALTESVGSVTSEVLPSYLPSPNFDGATAQGRGSEHGASTGDLGFVNVPLSPPPPPPLHTREEAMEPDNSRMRELRGVYEAVAHALESVRRV